MAVETGLHWGAAALYGVAAAVLAYAVIFGRTRRQALGLALAAVGLVPHGAAIVSRWIASGHGPYMMKYEVLSSNAWVAVGLLVAFLARRPRWSAAGIVVLPAAVLMVALAMFSNPEIRDLPPSLRSVWLVYHILLAKLSAGAFLLSIATAVLTLAQGRASGEGSWLRRLPPAEALDAFTVRFIGFGFVFWTCAVAAGAIWARESWGRYWGWDTIETWSLVTWLVYGTFLHVRLFFRPSPRATAWWSIGSFAVFILTLLVLPFLMPSLHSAYFQ